MKQPDPHKSNNKNKPSYAELEERIRELEKKIPNEATPEESKLEHFKHFKWAVENSSDAIGMASAQGVHWFQNKAFDDLFGDIGEDPPGTLYFNEEQGRKVFETIMSGDQWIGELKMWGKTREILNIFLRAYSIKDRDGKIIGLVGVHTDFTKQKKSELALQASEQQYRSLVDSMPDLIYRTDLNGLINFISPSVFRLSGYTEQESLGINMAQEIYVHPEERELFLSLLRKEGKVNNFEALLKRKDGSHWWASTNAHFFRDKEGKVVGVEGITRDISEKIESVTERVRLETQLHREEKMKSLGMMAGGIAHDLNNILSGIVSYPDLILRSLDKDSPIRKPLQVIQDSGERAAAVVSDLLTIARGITARKDVLNLNTQIREYLLSAEHILLQDNHPQVHYEFRCEYDLHNTFCSPVHIKKILMNLVTNATESIQVEGSVILSTRNCTVNQPLLKYETIYPGDYAVIKVEDTGKGISSEDLKKVFEPFYTKKVMGKSGTGLGLAVVWNSVQDHEGFIHVESDEKGTTFELFFPARRETVFEEKAETPVERFMGAGQRILVVDDEENQRLIAREMLTLLGYKVETVSSGESAIKLLENSSFDLLILDMMMDPGINGLETYSLIKEHKPKQKAIISSGYSKTENVKKAQEIGAGRFIKKPYLLGEMGMAVKNELER